MQRSSVSGDSWTISPVSLQFPVGKVCFLMDTCTARLLFDFKLLISAELQNKLPSTLQPALQFVQGKTRFKCNPTWIPARTNRLKRCQSRRYTLLCSKPIRVEVWHSALGQNLPLDELITHHLAVANVITTVDPLVTTAFIPWSV